MEENEMSMPGFTAEVSLYKTESKGMAMKLDQTDWVIPQRRIMPNGGGGDGCDVICINGRCHIICGQ
jgi:hypothetical protein